MVRLATFNLENLFTRPRAFALGDTPAGRQAIDDFQVLSSIIEEPTYSPQDKQTLVALSERYGFHRLNPPEEALIRLQKIRGQLFTTAGNHVAVAAGGRGDWTGWFELLRDNVSWDAVRNTGQVIDAVRADILVCIEVEDRPTLDRFNSQILGSVFGHGFQHVMLVDGNDPRGIDVGILSRFPIKRITSHVDDRNQGGVRTFSRDCPEYDIELQGGLSLVVLPNHFKSKRGGNSAADQERRRRQGERAHKIAVKAMQRSPLVIVAGDLNDTPDSDAVRELIKSGFADVQSHPSYPTDRPGTFGTGTASNKIDYIVLSSALREVLTSTGIERRGTHHPQLWAPFAGVTAATEASDHHCVWADVNL